jgi:prophage endopeptidase
MMPWKLIPLPYRILIIVAVAAAAAAFFYSAGHRASDNSWAAKYTERENELLKQRDESRQRVRELERQGAENNAAIDAAYQKGLTDAQAKTDRTIADLRSGNLRLRRDLAASACGAAGAPAPAGVGDGGADPGLWGATAEALVLLADEADGVVRQLTACQAVVNNYRALLPAAPQEQ